MAPVAAAGRPTPRPLPNETTPQSEALRQRRRPRRARLVAERHRVALAHPTVQDSLAHQSDDRQRLIHDTAAEVATRLRTRPGWREQDDL
jgi:hypothetical protein